MSSTKLFPRSCLFCRIIDNSERKNVLFENKYVIVLLDLFPASTGHMLVIPKYCVANVLTLPDQYLVAVARAQRKMAQLLNERLAPKGINFLNNMNLIAGQIINHYHLHLIPKYDENTGMSAIFRKNDEAKRNLASTYEKLTKKTNTTV